MPPLALAILFVSAPAALADQADCGFDPGSRTVSVVVNSEDGHHGGAPNIDSLMNVYNSFGPQRLIDCGADARGTDLIRITDGVDGGSAAVGMTSNAPHPPPFGWFAPGFTDEPGESDEIEFEVTLGAGLDLFRMNLYPGTANVVLGGEQINLNPTETDGVDADVSLSGTEQVTLRTTAVVDGHVSDAVIDGRGGAGTPDEPFALPMRVVAGSGDDVVLGGLAADTLKGGAAVDALFGGGGSDRLRGDAGEDVVSGGSGADEMRGGGRDDLLRGASGPDLVVGGGGFDRCRGGPGRDSFERCERITQ